MTPWDQICENGWASIHNADYVQVHGAGSKVRRAKWTAKGSKKPWLVAYVEPGAPWLDRKSKTFKTFEKAVAFINKRGV